MTHTGTSPSHSSQQDSFDNHLERQHQAPSQEASIPPGPAGSRAQLPFSCSPCHGSPASTWCPPLSAASPHLLTTQIPDPGSRRFNPAAAPQRLGLTGPSSLRLRGVAQRTPGLVVRPTKVRLQHPAVPPGSPTGGSAAPECYQRRGGCSMMAARWHPHLVVVLHCPQSVLISLPPRLAL